MLVIVDGRLVERECLPPWTGYGRVRGPVVEGVVVIEVPAGPDQLLPLDHLVKGHTRLLAIPLQIYCRTFCFPENKIK